MDLELFKELTARKFIKDYYFGLDTDPPSKMEWKPSDLTKEEYFGRMVSVDIAYEKYVLSRAALKPKGKILFCPVTVPEAVDYRLTVACLKKEECYQGMFRDPDLLFCQLRLELVWGYFSFDTVEPLVWMHGRWPAELDYESTVKTNRLEGELKRYCADLQCVDPHEAKVTPTFISDYCWKTRTMPIEKRILESLGFAHKGAK